MTAPQITWIVLMAIGIVTSVDRHGEKKPEPYCDYNIGVCFLTILLWNALLWWGGFWS